MDYHIFHWVWYFIGFACAPKLTIAIVLAIHGKSLHLPVIAMIFVWLYAIAGLIEIKKE